MRAIALAGLAVSEKDIAPFRLGGVDIALSQQVEAADAVLIFGGDGTVHRHLAKLHELQVPALVVPAGSGNDFAHSLGIQNAQGSLAAWKRFVAGQGNVRQIDLGCIEPLTADQTSPVPEIRQFGNSAVRQFFCCVGGVGLDGDANRRANAMPAWLRRHGGYLLAAALAILGKQRARIRAQAASPAGEPLLDADEQAEMFVFANAPTYGDGMLIAPGAKLDDGKLDLVYVRHASRLRLLRIAPTVLRGTHIGLPEVWFARAADAHVETDPPLTVYADGEPICQTPIHVTTLPKALKVICNG